MTGATIIDLTHEIVPQGIEQGAFALHCAVDSFPEGTIFCCVVDPGVGTSRLGSVGWIGKYGFSGPDNGLATPLLDRASVDVRVLLFTMGLAGTTGLLFGLVPAVHASRTDLRNSWWRMPRTCDGTPRCQDVRVRQVTTGRGSAGLIAC